MPSTIRPFKMNPVPANGTSPVGSKPNPHRVSLQNLLQELATTQPSNRRPLMLNLNGDNSFLISIPRPRSDRSRGGKAFFHIVTDPWLSGPAEFPPGGALLSLTHIEPEAYRSFAAVDLLIKAIENAALAGASSVGEADNLQSQLDSQTSPPVDTIVVSAAGTDHMHQPTLIGADPTVPVLAVADASCTIESWNHFETVATIADLGAGVLPIPSWFTVMRIPSPVEAQGLQYAILLAFTLTPGSIAEAILYTPHGIPPEQVEPVLAQAPAVQTLALLHPLNQTLVQEPLALPDSLGADNGLDLYRLLDPKYWVEIHDPQFVRSGLLTPALDFVRVSLEEALKREEEEQGSPSPRPNLKIVENGEFIIFA